MKREDPAVTAMREHMLAHLDSISDADERQALTKELQAYLWRYPFSVEELEGADYVGKPLRCIAAGEVFTDFD